MKTSRSQCSVGLDLSAFVRSSLTAQGALGLALAALTACGDGGNGGLQFSQPKRFGTGPAPLAIATADINGDGNLDLAVTNSGNDTASVLLGTGDGTFQGARSFSVGFAVTHLALAIGSLVVFHVTFIRREVRVHGPFKRREYALAQVANDIGKYSQTAAMRHSHKYFFDAAL